MNRFATALLVCLAYNGFSQGTINFQNRNIAAGVDAPISYAAGTPKGGANGARIDGAGIGATAMAGLFGGPDGATEDQLVLLAPAVNFRAGVAAGYVNVGTMASRTLNVQGATVAAGDYAIVQVRAWDIGYAGASYEQARTNGNGYLGKSNMLRVRTGGGWFPTEAADLIGLQAFSLVGGEGNSPPIVLNPIPDQTNSTGVAWNY